MERFKKIFLLFFLVFLFYSLIRNIFTYINKNQFYQDYKHTFEKENKKNIELKTEAVKKKSVAELEKTIRNKLNLLKENEITIILPETTIKKNISPTSTPSPNWVQWKNIFLKS